MTMFTTLISSFLPAKDDASNAQAAVKVADDAHDAACSSPVRAPEVTTPAAARGARVFPPAQLSQPGVDPHSAVALAVVHGNPGVQRAAAALQTELHRLVEASNYGLIAWALQRCGTPSISPTAAAVIASLDAINADVRAEVAEAMREKTEHETAARAILGPVRGLMALVADRAAKAYAEATGCRYRAAAMDQWHPGLIRDRRAALQGVLTPAELAAIGEPDTMSVIAGLRDRAATLESFGAACDRFVKSDDPVAALHHLDGLGFDVEVDALRAVVGAPAA